MQLVTIATFNSESPARALIGILQRAGVSAHVEDQRKLQRFWFLSKPYAGVRVSVPTEDFHKSTELIKHMDADDGILREAVRCPECGSSRVEYPQTTRKFILPTLVFHFLRALGLAQHNFYCEQCHYTWKKKPTRAKSK